MKSITYQESSFTGKLLCSLFGHKFRPVKSTITHREFECTVCKLQATNDLDAESVSLKDEFREIHNALLSAHRNRRLNQKVL